MKSIQSIEDRERKYSAVSIELLGKPINIIQEKLDNVLSESTSLIESQIQRWSKSKQAELSYLGVEFYNAKASAPDNTQEVSLRHSDGGFISLHVSNSILIALSDRFYGADVLRTEDDDTFTFTNSDHRFHHRLARLFSAQIAPENMWQEISTIGQRDSALVAQFSLSFQGKQEALLLVLDQALVQTLVDELSLRKKEPLIESFELALEQTPVKVSTTLCRQKMALQQVLNLKPNDILPIELLTNMPIHIGKQHLFDGRVAEQHGQLVLILNECKDGTL